METPDTRYATTDDGLSLAYQVVGEGAVDVVFEAGWVSNVDLMWEREDIAGFLRTIAHSARLIVFDKRGNGLSDRPASTPDLETLVGDLRTVMDAAGSERAALVGLTMGAAISAMFASTYPERTVALAMIQASARVAWAPDYPWGETPEYHRDETARIAAGWGTGEFERWFLDPVPDIDDRYVASLARYFRHSMSRGVAKLSNQIWWDIDISDVLPAIHTPTVVVHRHADPAPARFLCDRIPGSELWHVPDEANLPWSPGSEEMARRLLTFLTALREEQTALDRVLATVLFTDIVDSTAQAAAMGDERWHQVRDQHDRILRGALGRFGGREIKTLGDGVLATFDGPARAVACAKTVASQVASLGIEIRAGLHTGEVELEAGDVAGIAVAIGARVMSHAGPSEVFVSQTVKDLTAGSGLVFEDAGEHELKGVPDRWRLYRVVS